MSGGSRAGGWNSSKGHSSSNSSISSRRQQHLQPEEGVEGWTRRSRGEKRGEETATVEDEEGVGRDRMGGKQITKVLRQIRRA